MDASILFFILLKLPLFLEISNIHIYHHLLSFIEILLYT